MVEVGYCIVVTEGLECVFAEITGKDIGFALPDGAWHTPMDSSRLQAGGITMVLATHRPRGVALPAVSTLSGMQFPLTALV